MGSTIQSTLLTPRAAELYKFMQKSEQQEVQTDLIANISGLISDIKVSIGEEVTKGQPMLIVEAMKMENILLSPVDGIVQGIFAQSGQTVASGELLINIEPKPQQ